MTGASHRSAAPARRHLPLRVAFAVAGLSLLLANGGCAFLSDEFTWLDRAGPVADGPPDAPVTGLVDHP